jgi:hypothetical protein
MFAILRDKDRHYKFCYACALAGYSLIAFTYLFRAQLDSLPTVFDFSLGIMPNLAGSFATPFMILAIVAERFKNDRLMHEWKLFAWINLGVFTGALLFEYFHLWFNLGGFHGADVLASAAGAILSLLLFHYSDRSLSPEYLRSPSGP